VAPKAKVVAVKVLDCGGSGSWSGIIQAMEWVMENAQKPATANMSLAGGWNSAVNDAATALHASGVVTVVAAGNSDANACNFSPASADDVITVGSTDDVDSRSWFSNKGRCVDIFAPGSDIKSAWWESDDQYLTISGTSMASPHVCGGAALLLGGGTPPGDVDGQLISMATPNKISGVGNSPNLLLYVGGNGQPPTTGPPSTRPPTTLPPTTFPPSTFPPVTFPPVTFPPVTFPPSECMDSPTYIWQRRGRSLYCLDLTEKQCKKARFASHCPATCNKCANFECKNSKVPFWTGGQMKKYHCNRLRKLKPSMRRKKCNKPEIFETCRGTCKYCN